MNGGALSVDEIIRNYGLKPHPEGGHYAETYRSRGSIPRPALPESFSGPDSRAYSTAILYLLEAGSRSRLHRIVSDELWHFYLGGPLSILQIGPAGIVERTVLGTDCSAGHRLQHVVPGGHWFGATPCPEAEFSLVGCTVSPGFDFADFEMGARNRLTAAFPHLKDLIAEWTA